MTALFSHAEFTTRNLGFVTTGEQERLREAQIFVCGVGGMGGAAFMALVRAGVGRFVIADIDVFEVSNLNRQVFANAATIGQSKAESAAAAARAINPEIEIEVLGDEWSERLEEIAARCKVIVNGMDDIPAGIHLYRTAEAADATVIDAYMSPLPSVIVVAPGDPRPEARLGYPTQGKDWRAIDEADRRACMLAEIEYVMLHSSSRRHVDLTVAAEVAAGRRSRMSFAPMVISTGMLMAYEAVALVLGKPTRTDCRGWFLNPHDAKVERPLPAPVAALLRPLVRRALKQMVQA
jgi:molybdopterin/thiamine biosynthesis adenylyltransferase